MRLIDADELKEQLSWCEVVRLSIKEINQIIDDIPTEERTPGNCKTCKYYHPYYQMFSTETRGDGFCTISRLTSEGFLNINCKDDFYCSYYTKGNEEWLLQNQCLIHYMRFCVAFVMDY